MVDQYIVRGLAAIPSLGISLTLRRETLRIIVKLVSKAQAEGWTKFLKVLIYNWRLENELKM